MAKKNQNLGLDAISDTDSSEVLGGKGEGITEGDNGGEDINAGHDDPLEKVESGTESENDTSEESGDDASEEPAEGSGELSGEGEDSESGEDEAGGEEEEPASDDEEGGNDDEETQVVHSVANSLKEELGLELSEEVTKNLTNDGDGIQQLVKESAKELMERGVSNYFKQDPTLQKYKEFVIDGGGDPNEFRQTFFEKTSWNNVEFSPDNEAQQENIVREKLSRDGHSDESINKLVSKYKDTGMLDTQAEMDLQTIQAVEQQEEQQKIESQKQEQQMREEEEQRISEEIKDRIYNKRSVNGFKIDDPDGFHNYLYGVADKESGKSQYQLDLEQKSMDEQLSIPLMMYKNFDIQKEVEKKAKTKKADDLNKQLDGAKQKPKSKTNKRSNKNGMNALSDIKSSDVIS
jgi:hypothetical protein